MKSFFVECCVIYTLENASFSETYTKIVEERSETAAKIEAKKQSMDDFNRELNDENCSGVKIEVMVIYETSSDARCS